METIINAIHNYRTKNKRNIVICGPKMGEDAFEKRSKKFRVYSYGGIIAEFGYTPSTGKMSITFLDKEYYDSQKGYIKGEGLTFLSKKLPRGNGNEEEKKIILLNDDYWKYASEAAENRYSNVKGPKERNIESRILEKYINAPDSPFCIFDMEFFAPKTWKENYGIEGKPDLICFDKGGFGLIELKYNNQACEDGKNKSGLGKHFDDLRETAKNASPLIKELKRRVEICNEYKGIIMPPNICKKIKEAEESASPWIGFLFVNCDGTSPVEIIKRSKLDNSVRIMCVNSIEEISKWDWKTKEKIY